MKAPLIRGCRRTFSPSQRGEGIAGAFTRMQPCILATTPAVLRPAQRGEGGAAAPDEGPWEVGCVRHAAVREPDFIGGCTKSTKAPLIRGCRRTFSPSQRGEGIAGAFTRVRPCILATPPAFLRPAQRGEGGAAAPDEGPWKVGCDRRCSRARESLHRRLQKKHESAPHPRLPPHLLPVATGRRDQHALSAACNLQSCDSTSLPSPRAAGRRDQHVLSPECSLACLRQRQLSLRPAQRGEGGAAAPDEGPWEVRSTEAFNRAGCCGAKLARPRR